ncbi:MAG: Cof-type HAD-IIB family hydrolase [Candidatus Cohnella colombiensis]|uniref:Cof-type HAD-IIB family hydrolase n=1 Tax=Candidatus Cohnella colombiensis TaxID=3121368 RepID=A0AA95JG98_9BACL|nr:MAG: Cof-type HAD-IIB family hydrolase [Cohnella sp.]
MTFRLIAIDLDDTLLTDEGIVTEATREAMAAAIAHGAHVTIATGRMFASAQKIARQVGLNVPIITYQGSLIKNLLDEEVLYERYVPTAAALRIYEYCKQRGIHIQAAINDELYSPSDNEHIRAYVQLSKIPYKVIPDFETLLQHEKVTKFVAIDEPARLDGLLPELREMQGSEVYITKSKPNFLEFLNLEGTKGHALRFLAAHYDIPMEETIAVGDAMNDHEMIEAAGLGVAMGNAVPALKAIANFVTLSNNDDGVKHVLDKFILKRD